MMLFYDVWDHKEDFFGQVVDYYEDGGRTSSVMKRVGNTVVMKIN